MNIQARSTTVLRCLAGLVCALGWPLSAQAQTPVAVASDVAASAPASVATAASAAARAAPIAPAESADKRADRSEPSVSNTVVEDEGTRIDELKVRGQSKRVTVTPKKIGKPYEIITPSGGRDQTEGAGGSNGAVGKRVWPVFTF